MSDAVRIGTGARGRVTRRFVLAMTPLALAGCTTTGTTQSSANLAALADFEALYAAIPSEPFPIPRVDAADIAPEFRRQFVDYASPHPPGTIVVDPDAKFLYLQMEGGRAMRYGVGVGREGFGWNGDAVIRRKAAWPRWTPPPEMIARQPELEIYRRGMAGGLDNPLGARALYLFQGRQDTLYRLHGTNEPRSIGRSVSSGCIRLINQDMIDLHRRTPVGTRVVVLEHGRGEAIG